MGYQLNQEIIKTLQNGHTEVVELIKELCKIPAPLNGEKARAEFCKKWLEAAGAKGVYIDEVYNVVFPYHCENSNDISVFMAHMDTVFPDTVPMPLREADGKLYCPGVGDDTANLAMLLLTIKYILQNKLTPDNGCLFVCNSGEEGLGNLKGSKSIMKNFAGRVRDFYSFDGFMSSYVNYSVGSTRYKIEVKTEGGHSFANFGNKNAIAYLSALITELYKLQVAPNGHNTYNVGMIKGGTSVNTIAQQAEMLFEFRSDVKENLDAMMKFLEEKIKEYQAMGVEIKVDVLGVRPCMGDVDKNAQAALDHKIEEIVTLYYGKTPGSESSSTDCNIPYSYGVPAIAIGGYMGEGTHTREEWIYLDSLKQGYPLIVATVLDHYRNNHKALFQN